MHSKGNKELKDKMSLFEIAKELALIIDEIDMSQEESNQKFDHIKKVMANKK